MAVSSFPSLQEFPEVFPVKQVLPNLGNRRSGRSDGSWYVEPFPAFPLPQPPSPSNPHLLRKGSATARVLLWA